MPVEVQIERAIQGHHLCFQDEEEFLAFSLARLGESQIEAKVVGKELEMSVESHSRIDRPNEASWLRAILVVSIQAE